MIKKVIYGILKAMKVLLISLLLLSFLGVSALAFVTMYHGTSYGYKHCASEMATGIDCPVNPFAFADFHLNLFRGFSNAHLGEFINVFLASVTFLLLGLFFNLFRHNSFDISKPKQYRLEQIFESFTPLVESKTSYWLSLHENSPATQ